MKVDLSQFQQTHLQESAEHLDAMEADLLLLRSAPGDLSILNAIFRAAHSIKGGAGSLGLTNLIQFAHALENLLECLRSLELHATDELIDLLLQSIDILRTMLVADANGSNQGDMPEEALHGMQHIGRLLAVASKAREDRLAADETSIPSAAQPPVDGSAVPLSSYRVDFRPHGEMFLSGADPSTLLRDLAALGTVRVCQMHVDDLLALQELDPLLSYIPWTVELASPASEETLREVFAFVEHVADIHIRTLETSQSAPPDLADRRNTEQRRSMEASRAASLRKPAMNPVTAIANSSLRVAIGKVDRLMKLAAGLVSGQRLTAQMMEGFEFARMPELREAMKAMERDTRELQECVMAVRMMPVGPLFQRYARVLYDIAQSTGKQIRLETGGGETEIDKSLLELLSDTLTHLVRNAADHGIESPATRIAAGKAAEGVICMRAFHRAGRIVIEVSDDGAGIDTVRVRAKALEQGLIGACTELSDEQVCRLIFEPGLSTRESVTELSGRGVGMDVVQRNVEQLSGTVGVTSMLGVGSTVIIALPLRAAN